MYPHVPFTFSLGKCLLRHCSRFQVIVTRNISERKKFYKNVSITQSDGKFEINLDGRKLKTPLGSLFQVNNAPLATAVATEWDSQHKKIRSNRMHLTALCNTAIDNPNRFSKEDIAENICSFLETDTICFRTDEPDELKAHQSELWDPVVNWFNNRYDVDISPSYSLEGAVITDSTKNKLKRYLLSYNDWSIIGIQYSVDVLKSFILGIATLKQQLSIEEAVSLSRLEVEYQIRKWGNVEWSHDFDLMDTRSRVAAGILFTHFNSESSVLKAKNYL